MEKKTDKVTKARAPRKRHVKKPEAPDTTTIEVTPETVPATHFAVGPTLEQNEDNFFAKELLLWDKIKAWKYFKMIVSVLAFLFLFFIWQSFKGYQRQKNIDRIEREKKIASSIQQSFNDLKSAIIDSLTTQKDKDAKEVQTDRIRHENRMPEVNEKIIEKKKLTDEKINVPASNAALRELARQLSEIEE